MTLRRWEIWTWTCVFALLPLLLLVFVTGWRPDDATRELLSFALTLFILTLAELRGVDIVPTRGGYESLNNASVVGIAFASAIYGSAVSVHRSKTLGTKATVVAAVIACIALFVGTSGQIFIHRRKDNA